MINPKSQQGRLKLFYICWDFLNFRDFLKHNKSYLQCDLPGKKDQMTALFRTVHSPNESGQSSITTCAKCSSSSRCLPYGLNDRYASKLDKLIGKRRRVGRNELLFRVGDKFHNIYIVHSGHIMTFQQSLVGKQSVSGFHMAGDVIGMGAIHVGFQESNALALEDSSICEVPFIRLQELCAEVPALQQHFHRILSNEINRDHAVMGLLGMSAEQRIAIFLLDLSVRYAIRGYSPNHFQLHMSREAIGNYIGVTMECVSRFMSKFRQNGWITIDGKDIRICNHGAIEALAGKTDGGNAIAQM